LVGWFLAAGWALVGMWFSWGRVGDRLAKP
jgi:hypothetical protein